jgi:general secretion pathway protein H
MHLPGRHRGFTLIEILVAITIVAIVLSVTLLSMNLVGNDREVRTEAERLIALLAAARDDSLFQGREFGIEFLRGGYRFVEYDPVTDQWAEIPGDDMLRRWNLPEGIELSLVLENKTVVLEAEPAVLQYAKGPGAAPNPYAPHLLIFSSGEMTPFRLEMRRLSDQHRAVVEGNLLGRVEILDDEDDRA